MCDKGCNKGCNECPDECGCDIKLEEKCITLKNDYPCLEVSKGDTLEDFLESANEKICNQPQGEDGVDGYSAFDIAVQNGFEGTEEEWVASLTGTDGEDGDDGTDGETPTLTDNEDGTYTISTSTQTIVISNGTDGADGDDGVDGKSVTDAEVNSSNELVITLSDATTINAGVINTEAYDSGWIDIPDYDAGKGYGMAPLTNYSSPKFRVIGRIMFIEGPFLIPLEDGGVLQADASEYSTTHNTLKTPFSGSGGGFSVSSSGTMTTQNPLLPGDLRPSQTTRIQNVHSKRSIRDGTDTRTLTLSAFFPGVVYLTDNKILIGSVKDLEDGTTPSTYFSSSLERKGVTNVTSGDFAFDFDQMKTSFTGATDNSAPVASTYTYPMTINANELTDVGGFSFSMTFHYPIDESVTMAEIKDAIDNL